MTMSHRVTDSNSYLNALVMYAVLTKVPGVVSFHMSMVSMDVQDLAHFCVKSFRLCWPGCIATPEGGSHSVDFFCQDGYQKIVMSPPLA